MYQRPTCHLKHFSTLSFNCINIHKFIDNLNVTWAGFSSGVLDVLKPNLWSSTSHTNDTKQGPKNMVLQGVLGITETALKHLLGSTCWYYEPPKQQPEWLRRPCVSEDQTRIGCMQSIWCNPLPPTISLISKDLFLRSLAYLHFILSFSLFLIISLVFQILCVEMITRNKELKN